MDNELLKKYEEMKDLIKRLDEVIVAFSGGIDSALVLKVAHDALGNKVFAVTADSPSLPRKELEETRKIAEKIGANHIIINTEETKNGLYLENPSNRCYHCKTELYTKLNIVASNLGIKHIINGTNYDDIGDYRPGLKAADENNVISPLKDAKLAKKDVRELAKHLGLEVWDKPSSPCLSSRIPYGQEITLKKLEMIESAENFLKEFGIRELRVRHLGSSARIEVHEEDKQMIIDNLNFIEKKFNDIGFNEIKISNFKSGSLNVVLNVRAEN